MSIRNNSPNTQKVIGLWIDSDFDVHEIGDDMDLGGESGKGEILTPPPNTTQHTGPHSAVPTSLKL